MGDSVTYSVVERKNPAKREEPGKFYAQAQASGNLNTKRMSTRIEKACTVTRADVVAVLTALEDTIVEGLQRGEIVRLGEIGCFQISLSSKGADKEEDYNVAMIKKAKVLFRPGTALAEMLPSLEFSKVAKLPTRAKDPDAGGGGGGDIIDPTA